MKSEKPMVMFIRTTENCNANCIMCDFGLNSKEKEINKEEFENILSLVVKEKYKLIRFTGGETLLHKDLCHFIKRCKESNIKSSIITNGFLLNFLYKDLIKAGLNQIIISLDSNKPEIHEKIRNIPGLYEKIISVIKEIREYDSNIIIRVNTVASEKNIFDLDDMAKMLDNLKVDQWSIIPLKSDKNYWRIDKIEEYKESYEKFKKTVDSLKHLKLLGYSKYWAGRNCEEFRDYIEKNKIYTPRNKCFLVNKVRFYIPSKNLIVPCNNIPHRINEVKTEIDEDSIEKKANIMAKWLNINGPLTCTGCEPINVWLSEHPEDIEKDIFSF